MAIAHAVEEFLRSRAIAYEVVSHPRSVSSTRIAQVAHIPGNQLAKSVLLAAEDDYLMAVIPATHRVDLGRLHRQLNRAVGLAVEREVAELFGDCDPGAIPPLGEPYAVEVIVDDALLAQPDVYFEAGDHEALVHVSGKAFTTLMAGARHGTFTHHV
jgi:Ala-tRNA(Pro) deacylase